MVHYSPYNGRGGTYSGPLVTDNGFWDTFRAVYPMLTLLYPDHLGVIIEGWLNSFLEGGWLPTWASPGYRNCMVGTYADVVVADAIVRGVKGFNMKVAQRALEKDAFTEPPRLSGGSMGKEGLREYEDKGYISCDRHSCGDQVSRTLDFGFADWSTAQAFSVLADKPEFSEMKDTLKSQAQKLLSRSDRSYHSLFDSGMGLMRPKGNSGAFIFPFSDTEWGRGFTEGNTWHHSFPPYAIEGLAVMHGGKDKLLAKLHVMLNTQGNFGVGSYGQEIHEMTEARAVAMGQYAHNNQPAHHILFLFAMLGDRVTTEQSVRAIMDRAYGVEHFAGDEDNGEMGSWYVLSALGLFETVPGSTKYVFASPVFRHVRVARYDTSAAPPQGQRDQFGGWAASVPPIAVLDIVALGTGEKVTHVEQVLMDDAEVAGSFMEDAPLQKGGVLRFVMEGEKVNGVLPPFPGKDPSVTEESALRQQLASIPVPVDSGRSASSSDASAPDSSVLKALREELTHSQEVQAELHTRIHHLQLQDMNPSHCSRRLSFWVMLLMMAGVLAIAYSVASCFDALLGKGALMQTVNGMVGATHKYKNGKPESHVV
jgi:predicted alpha-1,2-mannosidase